jgi:hypothetical protein
MQSLNRGTEAVPSKNGKMYEKMRRYNAKKVLGTNGTHGTHYSARGKNNVPGQVRSQSIYEDFSRLLFLHAHREDLTMVNEMSEESEQFRFLISSRSLLC